MAAVKKRPKGSTRSGHRPQVGTKPHRVSPIIARASAKAQKKRRDSKNNTETVGMPQRTVRELPETTTDGLTPIELDARGFPSLDP